MLHFKVSEPSVDEKIKHFVGKTVVKQEYFTIDTNH